MISTHIIKVILLSMLLVSLSSHSMQSDTFKKQEIIIGQTKIDGQTYEYYLLINKKEKKSINIMNRTNRSFLLGSDSEKILIMPEETESMLVKNPIRAFRLGIKINFYVFASKEKIGFVKSDILLSGGNFTLMRRPVHKDEL